MRSIKFLSHLCIIANSSIGIGSTIALSVAGFHYLRVVREKVGYRFTSY